MGTKCCSSRNTEFLKEKIGNNINKLHFIKKYQIGKGQFSRVSKIINNYFCFYKLQVWKVQYKQNQKLYAMKEISKVKAYINESITSILLEKHFLSKLHHSLIANLNYAFHDKEYLYLILDYLPGGELRYYMKNNRYIFSESQIKFFVSNIILSLKYIHNNNIIHRDIKPENLIFDDKGYLHITDFNISRKIKKDKSILDRSGTIGYISPELLLNKPQNFASDFFSVGVICYELIMGERPFGGDTIKEVAEEILFKRVKLNKDNLPENYSLLMGDFINKLLKRNDKKRLGYKSIDEIIDHPWLEGINWRMIEEKSIDSELIPFQPPVGDNFDNDNHFVNKNDYLNVKKYDKYLKKINNSRYFKDFYFNCNDNIIIKDIIIKDKFIKGRKSIPNMSNNKYMNVVQKRKSSPELEPQYNNISMINNDNNNSRDLSLIKKIIIDNNDNKNNKKTDSSKKDESDFQKKTKKNYIKANKVTKKNINIEKGNQKIDYQ